MEVPKSKHVSLAIEYADDGSSVTVAVRDFDTITTSRSVHDLVTLDFDEAGDLVQVEILAVPIYPEGS